MLFQIVLAGIFSSSLLLTQVNAPAKNDPMIELLAKLRKPVDLSGTMSLGLFAEAIETKAGLQVLVNEEAFEEHGESDPTALAIKIPRLKSSPLSAILKIALAHHKASYLVRRDHIEIVPIAYAMKEAGAISDDESPSVVMQPLVSAIFREKPLNEALAEIAENCELTIIVAPQAGDNKTGFVNARLLNVPANQALELLVLQSDLRVIHKGRSFVVTSRDHAGDISTNASNASSESPNSRDCE